jgi:rhodanese-related sulfurtransferase
LKDEKGKPTALFSGDTLFVGDVGRPDLSSGNLSREELASMMFDSLREKILILPDETIIYPAHGPGSSCGKNLGPDTFSTLGDQKKNNYALQEQSREEFIKAVTEGLPEAPLYFPINARINKEGYDSLNHILNQGLTPLNVQQFAKIIKEEDPIILDTRKVGDFTQQFIPGSISIGLEGRFAEWAGSLLPFDKPIILVTEPGKEKESVVRLARVGFAQMKGYLEGGLAAWKNAGKETDLIIDIEPDELAIDLPYDHKLVIVDVRRETEFADGHIKNATNIPLIELADPGTMANIEDYQNVYIHCSGGYRSVIAASLMKRQGIHNLHNVVGGWSKIKEQNNIEVVKENSVLN